MANRFPLVLDTTDGNKIKELPDGDNLDLTNSSIISVNDITSAGTIYAQDLRIRGNTIAPVNFNNLADTPANYDNASNYFVKVNSSGTGIIFSPLDNLGTINVNNLEAGGDVVPNTTNTGNVGTDSAVWQRVRAINLVGNLVSESGSIVFNANTGLISYGAIGGVPTNLSEFTDDIGFVRTSDLSSSLSSLFSSAPFISDIQGSVFGDDSTVLVDGVNSKITGDIDSLNVISALGTFGSLNSTIASISTTLDLTGSRTSNLTVDTAITGVEGLTFTTSGNLQQELINIQPAATGEVNIQADKIRFIGDIVAPITAGAGFVGDLTGSVVADDSTVIIDSVAGKIISPNITGTATFENNVVIAGDLVIQGSTTELETTNTSITDNIIVLNKGEAGAGVTAGSSGIEIDRGTQTSKTFVWDETSDKWTVGLETLVAATFEGALTGNITGDVLGDVTGDLTGDSAGTHTGAVIGNLTGNTVGYHTGDITGSVFADDSTLLIDSVNGKIISDALTRPIKFLDDEKAIFGSGDDLEIFHNGTESYIKDAAGSLIVQASNFSVQDNGSAETAISAADGVAKLYHTNTEVLTTTATGVTITGVLTGNIDNTTLALGATATTINIGNATSTTNITGTVSFNTALFANNITADDSIIIQTEGNTASEGITLFPQGSDTTINLRADGIRLFGTPFTDSIAAHGGIVGDIKGSVVGDDSTILVDSVNNVIPKANVESSTTWDTAFAWGNHGAAGYQSATAPFVGEVIGSVFGDDSTVIVDGVNNTLNGNLVGNVTGDVTGNILGDDSSVMIDSANYAMFSDTMHLTPLSTEPANPVIGMMALADGISWDPLSNSEQSLVVYLNGDWRQIAAGNT
jgi:hypothetical protein